jgi:hypothetical protein
MCVGSILDQYFLDSYKLIYFHITFMLLIVPKPIIHTKYMKVDIDSFEAEFSFMY